MRNALKRAATVVLVVLLATTAASAAVQFDNETTDTTTESDIHPNAHVVEYNESASIYLEAEVESTTPAFEIVDPETNETVAYRSGDDLTQEFSDTSSTPSTYHYSTEVSQSVLSSVEMAAGENKTLEVTVISNESASTPTTSTQEMYVHNDPKRTLLVLEDSEVGDDGVASLATESTLGIQMPWNSEAATIDQSVPVNGSSTSATIDVENSTVADRLSQSASGMSAADWVPSTIATVDDEPTEVYMDEAPDSASNETHMVYHSGTDELELVTGDDYSGESADVSINANRGITDQFGVYGADVFSFSLPF